MQNILSRVNSIMGQFDSVSRNLDWDIRAESNINSRLSGISRELSAEARGISGMKNYLGNAVRQYNTVENTNKKNKLKDEVSGHNSGTHVKNNNNKTNKTGGTSTQFGGSAPWIIGKDGKPIRNTGYLNFNGVNLGPVIPSGGMNTSSANSTSAKSGYKVNWAKGAFDIAGKFGIVGSFAKSTYSFATGITEDPYKQATSFTKYGKDALTRFGKIADNAFSDSPNVKKTLWGDFTAGSARKDLFKNTNITSPTNSQVFKATFQKNFFNIDDYKFSNAKTVGGNIKVATKWAGSVLSLATNTISNVKEYEKSNGKMSKTRFVAEIASETVWDAAIGAGATALATLALGPAAPAVAVGALGAVAVWGLDQAVRWGTSKWGGEEKGLTEAVSDFTLDTIEAAGKGIKKGAKAIAKWGKSLFGG